MTPTARLHEIVVAAPDGASALALEYRLAHLCPVTISRDNAWVVEIDGVESPDEVAERGSVVAVRDRHGLDPDARRRETHARQGEDPRAATAGNARRFRRLITRS